MRNPADRNRHPEAKRILEAALLASPEPLSLAELKRCSTTRSAPTRCAPARRAARGLERARGRAGEPRERLALPDAARVPAVPRAPAPEKPPRYSRAVHGDARDHRLPPAGDARRHRGHPRRGGLAADHPDARERAAGSTSSATARRPGRPALYATTRRFLDDLGLRSLEELPPLEEIAKTLQLGARASPAASSDAEVRQPEVRVDDEPRQATGTDG